MIAGDAARVVGAGLGGFLLGLASFVALRRNAALYLTGDLWRPIGLHVARLSVVVAALALAARLGPGPLLAAGGGLTVARYLVVRGGAGAR